jgi:hypothetical protein
MMHGIEKIIDAKRTAAKQDSVPGTTLKDTESQFITNALNVDQGKLTSVLAGIVDILRKCGRGWIILKPIFGLSIASKMRKICSPSICPQPLIGRHVLTDSAIGHGFGIRSERWKKKKKGRSFLTRKA